MNETLKFRLATCVTGTNFLPDLLPYMQNFTDNGDRWIKLIPEYDEKLSKFFSFLFIRAIGIGKIVKIKMIKS